MIEVPRGALTADEIAQTAEFFSFGTNDLTQTALGISRDDMGSSSCPTGERDLQEEPVRHDRPDRRRPADEDRVEPRAADPPDIKLGICGEHGGDPDSVKFCHKLGLTYVSCSPFRVPVARLAAAQAAIEEGHRFKSCPRYQF
jgi:pyruvate, orthophosphate dikinase